MKARVVQPGEARPGMVLSRGAGALQKGAILTAENLAQLPAKELHVIEMEAGELHEDAAGQRLARAAAGEGLSLQPISSGSWPLAAARRGIVEIDQERLARLNDSDELVVMTLPDGQIVVENEIVARAKIIPFVTREAEIARAEMIGRAVRVRPFVPLRVTALVQETIDDASLEKFRAAFAEKLRFFGSEAPTVERAPGDPGEASRRAVAHGAQLVVMAGSKLMDPLDPAVRSIEALKQGVPVHPGTLLWFAEVGGAPVIGAPACALFSRPTAFDLLLPRLLAGERLSRASIARLGAGGLLTRDLAFRFPPYRAGRPRGEIE